MIWTYFLMGFVGGLHCLGMCGPIILALPIKKDNIVGIIQNILYQSGRVITYAIMGILFGTMGKGIKLAGMQQYLSILIGSLMVISVLIPQKKIKKYSYAPVSLFLVKIKSIFSILFNKKSFFSFFAIGLLNGLLPCGLVYVAIAGSLESSDILVGGLIMVVFGVGTMPIMFFATWFIKSISISMRNNILKLIPIFVIIVGSIFILRGLGLKIPYISPAKSSLEIKEVKK